MRLRRLALTCATVLPLTAFAGAVDDDKVEYYLVYGATPNDLRESLNRSGPVGADGKRHDAFTRWNIAWKSWSRSASNGCAVTTLDVTLTVGFVYPKWRDEGLASTTLVQQWRTYMNALTRHEKGHKSLDVEASNAIKMLGVRLPPQPTCPGMTQMVNDSANAILEQYRQKNQLYDRDTDHGRSQGARFP